jgi:hypothetical protein
MRRTICRRRFQAGFEDISNEFSITSSQFLGIWYRRALRFLLINDRESGILKTERCSLTTRAASGRRLSREKQGPAMTLEGYDDKETDLGTTESSFFPGGGNDSLERH